MINNNDLKLPTNAMFKQNCYHSAHHWFCYQSNFSEVRLINLSGQNISITKQHVIEFNPDPLKAVRLIYDYNDNNVFVALMFLARFQIYRQDTLMYKNSLPLKCNIADFQEGFQSCDAVIDDKQQYFVFSTKIGDLHIFPIKQTQVRIVHSEAKQRVSSLCVMDTNAYLGFQDGSVNLFNMNKNQVEAKYDTQTGFPILHIVSNRKDVYLSTCTGEIHILDRQLQNKRIISLAPSMFNTFKIIDRMLCTVTDQCIIRFLKIENDGSLSGKKQMPLNRKVNTLFNIINKIYYTYYEESNIYSINDI